MYKNDVIGDCTIASAAHMIELWTASTGAERSPTDEQVVAMYSAVTGYDPRNPQTDQGAVELDVLNYWRKTGLAGDRIYAFVQVDPRNQHEFKAAMWLFGGLYLGLALPVSAQAQVGRRWSVQRGPNGQPGSWGGHAVPATDYNRAEVTVVTWGATQRCTWGFIADYCEEAYAVLSPDWVSRLTQKAPSGFDLAALQADLSKFTKPYPSR
jgi:hypothetical protein